MSATNLAEKHNRQVPQLVDKHSQHAEIGNDTSEHQDHDHEHGLEWLELVRIGFVALAAAAV